VAPSPFLDLVRDAGREPAQRRHFLGMDEPGLRILEAPVGPRQRLVGVMLEAIAPVDKGGAERQQQDAPDEDAEPEPLDLPRPLE